MSKPACANLKRYFFPLIILFLALSVAGYTYPAKKFYPLKNVEKGTISGEAVLERQGEAPYQMLLAIDVWSLEPNAIYSAWLVNEAPDGYREPLGVDVNHFKTDASGKGRYVTTVLEYYFDKYQYLTIYRHPDNDPGNIKDMAPAVRGDIKYGWHS